MCKEDTVLEKIKNLFPFKESTTGTQFVLRIVFTEPGRGLEIKIGNGASLFIYGNKSELYLKNVRSFPTFYTALYIFSTYIHLKNNSLIVHGAGIRINKNGYIFAGASGTGKTTIARKFYPDNLLNDEAVAIKYIKNNFYLKETPFGTLYSHKKDLIRVKAIFLIKPTKKISIQKVNFPYSISQLLVQTPFLHYFKNELRKKSFLLVFELCKKIPVFRTELTLKSDIKKIIKMVSE